MTRKIIITGATGLIGKCIFSELTKRGDEVTVFTRNIEYAKNEILPANRYVKWDYNKPEEWKEHLNSKDAVIHLAGASLYDRRWTKSYKRIIVESRETSTFNIVNAIKDAEEKPKVFICSSGVGYYGDSGDKVLVEGSQRGNSFTAKVCEKWEQAAAKVEKYSVRRVSIRTGIVLNRGEGTLKKMTIPFKFFVGGTLGNGKQWFPWIHINDLANIFLFALDNNEIEGALNTVSPNPVRMKEMTDEIGRILHRPSFFKVPHFALRIALGELADEVTASLRVKPQKLNDYNFKFQFENISLCLKDLLR